MDNLAELLLCHPDEAAAVRTPDGDSLTYRELNGLVGAIAAELVAAGLTKGQRVAYRGAKSVSGLSFYLACLSLGLIYVPLNPAYRKSEVEFFLRDSKPSALFIDGMDEERARFVEGLPVERVIELPAPENLTSSRRPEFVALAPGDLAALLYTSGTTGTPKGAMITHASLIANARSLLKVWRFSANDTVLHTLPIFHGHGLFLACHLPLMAGGTILLASHFDVDLTIDLLPQSTVFMGVPTLYVRLLQSMRFDHSACRNLRLATCGSAPLPIDVLERVRARSGIEIVERYGTTETSICTSNPVDGERRPGTVGLALPDVELKIIGEGGRSISCNEIGQLAVRGPNVFPGYWQQPQATTECFTTDGFFVTGDLARRCPDGYVTIVGREKDMIISGGFNVYAAEVEAVLRRFEGVSDCAVVGSPHPDFGEAVVAVVVPEAGRKLDVSSLRAFIQIHLANYKVPKAIILTDELPRTAMGKVLKSDLRDRHRELFKDRQAVD